MLAAGALQGVTPRGGWLDEEFTRVPFAEWAAQGKQSGIRWSVEVAPAQNSTHQRLIAVVRATVDGRELEKRRGQGMLTTLIQFEDSEHRLWQNDAPLNLETIQKGVAASNIQISQYAFVLPGDYTVSIAICDTATMEHSFAIRKLHVSPIPNDPLPQSWAGLPAVEFIRADWSAPDSWFLPDITHGLNLPVTTKRPVHVEVLVNVTPSERVSASTTALRQNMSLLIPALKVLTSMRLTRGSVSAALIDLTDQRVPWRQNDMHHLDWEGMRRFLQDEQPGKIDVHALASQQTMKRFFTGEIAHAMNAPGEGAHVVIVLSGPAFLLDQEPAELPPYIESPDRRLIYVRERSFFPEARPARPGGGRGAGGPRRLQGSMPPDDLERALMPLNPRVYEALTAEQFRQVLASILQQIAAM